MERAPDKGLEDKDIEGSAHQFQASFLHVWRSPWNT
jgi:hypothetical protein